MTMNQPPPLVDYNVFEADLALREALEREGAEWAQDWLHELGEVAGTEQAIEWGFQAIRPCSARTTGSASGSTRSSSIPHGTS